MKYASKSQLAEAAGVSYKTFQRWIKRNEQRLLPLGYIPSSRLLSPALVRFICAEYDIDLDEL